MQTGDVHEMSNANGKATEARKQSLGITPLALPLFPFPERFMGQRNGLLQPTIPEWSLKAFQLSPRLSYPQT
jgi:hypothetical protein